MCRYKLCSADVSGLFRVTAIFIFTERVVSIVSHTGNLLFYLAIGCLCIVGAIYGCFEMPESKNKNTSDSPDQDYKIYCWSIHRKISRKRLIIKILTIKLKFQHFRMFSESFLVITKKRITVRLPWKRSWSQHLSDYFSKLAFNNPTNARFWSKKCLDYLEGLGTTRLRRNQRRRRKKNLHLHRIEHQKESKVCFWQWKTYFQEKKL